MKINLEEFEKHFKDRKVLITGHSGFKGKWLCRILKSLNSRVYGISSYLLNLSEFGFSKKSDLIDVEFISDISNDEVKPIISKIKPDYIFHFAAQALVKKSFEDPLNTFKVNTLGTCVLLDALRNFEKECKVVLITSDKVYENQEWIWGYREIDRLGGKDPYSASKAMAEIAINSYLNSFNYREKGIKIAIGRAGNVIGGGDWSEDRLIPDLVRSALSNKVLIIRSPNATRPWQHVLDPLFGYLKLAIELKKNNSIHGEPFNFGPNNQESRSVISICEQVKDILPEVKYKIEENNNNESRLLQLDCNKSNTILKYRSRFDSYESVMMSINWYKEYIRGKEQLQRIIDEQINL